MPETCDVAKRVMLYEGLRRDYKNIPETSGKNWVSRFPSRVLEPYGRHTISVAKCVSFCSDRLLQFFLQNRIFDS